MTTTRMQTEHQAHVAFHFTGMRTQGALQTIDDLDLRPALLARYRDLASLRYDFPVVLLRENADAPYASLTSIMDRLLEVMAPEGGDQARVRKHLLRHEAEMRRLVAGGATGALGKLWDLAARSAAGDSGVTQTLAKARAALDYDGHVVDCDATLPPRLFICAWRFVQEQKTRKMRAELDRLVLKLSDILQADFAASEAARTPQQLKACVGTTFENAFDFEQMSAILKQAPRTSGLSASRRARIEAVLAALESQRFFAGHGDGHKETREPYTFVYTSCADVESAYRERMPELIELAKAMAIAALEIKGEYDESRHDALFDAFGANGLSTEELAQFPGYFLWMYAGPAEEYGELTALLGASVPVKVLMQYDDLLEESPFADGRLRLSVRSKQLADGAIGLNTVYVLQSSASNLVQMREAVVSGFAYSGPALFSVYSGALKGSSLPPYLASAAAMECRAFPAFAYDPSKGPNWAARFSIEGNPQSERDWPVQLFSYEDADHQSVTEEVAFTLIDYMACDLRYARHFAKVPAAHANGDMVTVHAWLAGDADRGSDRVPCLTMVDARDIVQKVIVDDNAIREANRCRDIWHSLQELGGIHNSHAERLLARERKAWDDEMRQASVASGAGARPATAIESAAAPLAAPVSAAAPAAAVEAAAIEEKHSDEAFIETPRCTTCEECVQINNKLFVYDANKQAYIADIAAGTYRQLVEAAESCQVSIIHPGKPRNASEPGLEELVARAEPFA